MQPKLKNLPAAVSIIVVAAVTAFLAANLLATHAVANLNQFLGTWTATHSNTPIVVLTLHSANDSVSGTVQVASYNVSEVTGKVDVVTNPTLSAKSPIDNVKISGNSVSFTWKDPDGDTDHWRLDTTDFNSGKIVWLDLPAGAKMQPIPVAKNAPEKK